MSAELMARTVGAQETPSGILTASASMSRRLLGVDSTFVAVSSGGGDYAMAITNGIREPDSRDFVHVVCELEGLCGMACVPVAGPDGAFLAAYLSFAEVCEASYGRTVLPLGPLGKH